MTNFNDILEKHTKIGTSRDVYKLNEDLEITVDQKDNKVVMWGFNYKTDRFLNLSTKRFKTLMDGFKLVSTDLYSSGNYYYITIGTPIDNAYTQEKTELEKLKDNIQKLINENEQLKAENQSLKTELEKCSQIKMNIGRKKKFTDKDIQEIKKLRDQNKSIREIAKEFDCSVGLVHKLVKIEK